MAGKPVAGKPVDDLATAIFDLGLVAFSAAHVSEKSARSLIGKARKDLGDEGAAQLMAQLASARPPITDPTSYVIAACKARPGNGVVL